MKRKVALREVANVRAGDKGNISSISVWAKEPRFYAQIKAQLTAELVKATYPRLFAGPVRRYELDHIQGLNFVLEDAIEGGVNTSLNLDSHGKSWSFLILQLTVEIDDEVQSPPQPSSSKGSRL